MAWHGTARRCDQTKSCMLNSRLMLQMIFASYHQLGMCFHNRDFSGDDGGLTRTSSNSKGSVGMSLGWKLTPAIGNNKVIEILGARLA